jgi:hypothetical protein
MNSVKKSSSMICASHYGEHEKALSLDPRVIKLCNEYVRQGGKVGDERSFDDTLVVNEQAHKRGINFNHIGAIMGAFELVMENVYDTIRLMSPSEDDGMSPEQKANCQRIVNDLKAGWNIK